MRSVDLSGKAGRREQCILHLMAAMAASPGDRGAAPGLDQLGFAGVASCARSRSELFLPLAPQTLRIPPPQVSGAGAASP